MLGHSLGQWQSQGANPGPCLSCRLRRAWRDWERAAAGLGGSHSRRSGFRVWEDRLSLGNWSLRLPLCTELMNRFCSLAERKEIRVKSRISALLIFVKKDRIPQCLLMSLGPSPRSSREIGDQLTRHLLRSPPSGTARCCLSAPAALGVISMVFSFGWLTFLNWASSCVIIAMKSSLG